MKRNHLLNKLKEFHVLESYQVYLYGSQLKALEDMHIKKAYERFIMTEQEHVDYYDLKLRELGSSPLIITPAFAAAGFVTGKALDLLNIMDRYKLGISVENKAVQMYFSFIEMSAKDPELAELNNTLWSFMVDEETHQFWFKEQLSKMSHFHNNQDS
jgi:demethoxyubiquinone hydroxylase (CLK1/Coq7/Cat5 family)